ncbi:methyl-accepting chemotaxis protein [Ferviditalea candida]|uniref:Methyl-accepting chemotaxis protein n=1 Tax=Ferviditalea candida TaxID=3108399 RepID=A0ABU5ZID6_9BACL|nr:methyl-accepting chemotaxis protein [Paenibacillaceae bacterium T2]
MNLTKSVGLKLFLNFFVSIVFFVLLAGLISYYISKDVITKEVADTSMKTMDQSVGRLDLQFKNYENITTQMMLDTSIKDMLRQLNNASDSFDKLMITKKLTEKFNSYALANKEIAGINFFSGSDLPSFSSFGRIDDSYKNQDWYKKIIAKDGKPFWMDTHQKFFGIAGQSNGQESKIAVGRLWWDTVAGTNLGALVVEIRVHPYLEQLKNIQIAKSGSTMLINPDKTVMMAADEKSIGAKTDIPVDTSKQEPQEFNYNGQLVVVSRSASTGWFLVGAAPLSELLEGTDKIFWATFGIAGAAALLAVLIGYLVVRMIGRPLVELRNLMQQGAQGNLNVRTAFRSKDEIGQVGDSFNTMMEQIMLLVKQTNLSAQEVLNNAAELSDSSKKTAIASKEISIATEEIANGAATLAVEAERGNDLTQHISTQMDHVVQANIKMGSAASEMEKVSHQGIEYMGELIKKTNATEEITRSMVEKVNQLKESTLSIRKILEVLNNLTKQTNILSLNATIEAARAGAAGKGFMVVAHEIRKLADQSRQSIDVVGQITETIQTEIDETVSVMSEAYPLFQEQIDSVKEADLIFKNVQENMQQFILQLDDVTGSIQQLEESQRVLSEAMASVSAVSQQSSATSEEVASLSSEQLNVSEELVQLSDKLETVSNSLKDSLSKFRF